MDLINIIGTSLIDNIPCKNSHFVKGTFTALGKADYTRNYVKKLNNTLNISDNFIAENSSKNGT